MFHVSTLLPYTPNNKQQVKTNACCDLSSSDRLSFDRMLLNVNKWNATNPRYDFCFHIRVSYVSEYTLLFLLYRPVAEKAAHRERHSHHSVPGARRSPFHPQGDSLSLSTCLHHRASAQPLLRQHVLQVGLCAWPAEMKRVMSSPFKRVFTVVSGFEARADTETERNSRMIMKWNQV